MSSRAAGKSAKPAPPSAPAGGVKKVAAGKKAASWRTVHNIGEKRPKNFGLGIRAPPKQDLTRFVRWPKYVRLQRQRKILLNRMKVPPVVAQFGRTLDKGAATLLFKLLNSHRPETPEQKKARLLAVAASKEGQANAAKPNVVKAGIRHVTALVEQKKAKLVVIANDVDPLELVLWLPTLCKKKGIPYVIVKNKARLGQVVGKKTATALAFVNIDNKDKADFANLVQIATEQYNDAYATTMKTYGGLGQGLKHMQAKAKRLAAERAAAKKA
jgi:large subunit ribosomal protein L7Ae